MLESESIEASWPSSPLAPIIKKEENTIGTVFEELTRGLAQIGDQIEFSLPDNFFGGDKSYIAIKRNAWQHHNGPPPPPHQAEAGTSRASQQSFFAHALQPEGQSNINDMLIEILRLQREQTNEVRGIRQEMAELRRIFEDNAQRLDVFGEEFADLHTRFDDYGHRLDRLDDYVCNMEFYHQYGYYPGGFDDPNLYPDHGDAPR